MLVRALSEFRLDNPIYLGLISSEPCVKLYFLLNQKLHDGLFTAWINNIFSKSNRKEFGSCFLAWWSEQPTYISPDGLTKHLSVRSNARVLGLHRKQVIIHEPLSVSAGLQGLSKCWFPCPEPFMSLQIYRASALGLLDTALIRCWTMVGVTDRRADGEERGERNFPAKPLIIIGRAKG